MKQMIDGHTRLLGVMATPIRHSMSPAMHNAAFEKLGLNNVYLAFEVGNDDLEQAVNSIRVLDMIGVNVSMPNKQKIIPYLDELDISAELNQAVNTVVNNDGYLKGYTTDGVGFVTDLQKKGHPIKNQSIVIAGAGGAGTPIAIQCAMAGAKEIKIFNEQGPHFKNVARNVAIINERTNSNATGEDLNNQTAFKEALASCDIYCDATSVGMSPLQDQSLINHASYFHSDMVVYDVVYSPRETKLMTVAKKAGVKEVYNGLGMMIEQGAAAFKLWTGEEMPVGFIKQTLF
ncbi:shikimate dehydrogenase [Holzapfeliella sp. He02]|uniref:Shikimate dehydrogenase (NADP(+)) n=1 Tax=Holzapfeliella saturejae TaxID=3082953 RepID=A0ABU8SJZ5_9LACO